MENLKQRITDLLKPKLEVKTINMSAENTTKINTITSNYTQTIQIFPTLHIKLIFIVDHNESINEENNSYKIIVSSVENEKIKNSIFTVFEIEKKKQTTVVEEYLKDKNNFGLRSVIRSFVQKQNKNNDSILAAMLFINDYKNVVLLKQISFLYEFKEICVYCCIFNDTKFDLNFFYEKEFVDTEAHYRVFDVLIEYAKIKKDAEMINFLNNNFYTFKTNEKSKIYFLFELLSLNQSFSFFGDSIFDAAEFLIKNGDFDRANECLKFIKKIISEPKFFRMKNKIDCRILNYIEELEEDLERVGSKE